MLGHGLKAKRVACGGAKPQTPNPWQATELLKDLAAKAQRASNFSERSLRHIPRRGFRIRAFRLGLEGFGFRAPRNLPLTRQVKEAEKAVDVLVSAAEPLKPEASSFWGNLGSKQGLRALEFG